MLPSWAVGLVGWAKLDGEVGRSCRQSEEFHGIANSFLGVFVVFHIWKVRVYMDYIITESYELVL